MTLRQSRCQLSAADACALQRLAQNAEHAGELPLVFYAQFVEQLGHCGAVLVVDPVHGPLALPGHLYDGGPPICRMRLPPYQPLFFQRVDQRGDVASGNTELVADAAHDLGPFAMQGSEQPHPGVGHPPILQPRPDPLQIQWPERGELVDEPQRRILYYRFTLYRAQDTPRTRSTVPTPLTASYMLTYIIVNVTVYIYTITVGRACGFLVEGVGGGWRRGIFW